MRSGAELAAAALEPGAPRGALARLVGLMEDQRPAAADERDAALAALADDARRRGHRPVILGLTGTPGSGKSSLLATLTRLMLLSDQEIRLAVVAVDPSSPTSGGALLGDRTRMRTAADERRLFFRSQASVEALGGLAPSTYEVCRALSLVVDAVIVETVGIGQSEADIRHLADRVYLVMAPNGGDDVQLLKAGIVEVPDAFVVNKADDPSATRTYHQLKASLWLARPFDADDVAVHLVSALRGDGLDTLAQALLADIGAVAASPGETAEAREAYFFRRWVRDEWGRTGLRHLDSSDTESLTAGSGFGTARRAFDASIRATLGAP